MRAATYRVADSTILWYDMDMSSLGIPNIRTTKVGSRRDGVEIIEAVVRLEAWDGYLVKRWERGPGDRGWDDRFGLCLHPNRNADIVSDPERESEYMAKLLIIVSIVLFGFGCAERTASKAETANTVTSSGEPPAGPVKRHLIAFEQVYPTVGLKEYNLVTNNPERDRAEAATLRWLPVPS